MMSGTENPRRSFLWKQAPVLCLVFTLSACHSSRLELSVRQQAVRAQLQEIASRPDPLPARTPVIDVHTHTFNARYLPLRGILWGKRDAAPPFTWLVSDRCAEMIAEALIDHTALSPAGSPGIARRMGTSRVRASGTAGPVCRLFLNILDKARAAGAWNETFSKRAQIQQVEKMVEEMTPAEKIALKTAVRMMGMDHHMESKSKNGGLKAAARFLWTLTQSDASLIPLYHQMHQGPPVNGSIQMVSHMMDLAPVYDQTADGEMLLKFEEQQVKRMETFTGQPGASARYFVAWNPYRDHWQCGRPGNALRAVQEAIQKHGAAGVKIYPPSGYRAAGNVVHMRPRALFTPYPGRQWDARYGKSASEAGKSLNRSIEELLLWCRDHDVPVFTHCGHGEFEARKGYGEYHAHPAYWRKFLESHPEPDGSPCRLRLCLGHAGGDEFWFGGRKFNDWGREVYEMCTRFPNVYCEITTGEMMTDPDRQAFFVDTLARLFAESAAGRPWPFARKLLYGTDWPLPDPGDPGKVLRATQNAFLHPDLRSHYQDYFAGNARRYLGRRKCVSSQFF
jgi:predicted TIM-barrel fold metal-dependent hydrolase